MATEFNDAASFKEAFDAYNSEYPESKGHKQYLEGHHIPLDLNYEGVQYRSRNDKLKEPNVVDDKYSTVLDILTQAISKAWKEDVMRGWSETSGEEGSEFWHQIAIYKIRRGFGLLQRAAYTIAANSMFWEINGTSQISFSEASLDLDHQQYLTKDERKGADGHDYAYSSMLDAITHCELKFYDHKVIEYIKEGIYEIATGD